VGSKYLFGKFLQLSVFSFNALPPNPVGFSATYFRKGEFRQAGNRIGSHSINRSKVLSGDTA
jgi:hypothetical protein